MVVATLIVATHQDERASLQLPLDKLRQYLLIFHAQPREFLANAEPLGDSLENPPGV